MLAGCELTVPVDLPDQSPKLVMNTLLHPGDTIHAYLSRSFGMYEDFALDEVVDATYIVEDMTNGASDTLQPLHNPPALLYQTIEVPVLSGHTYRFRAVAPGYEAVTGETTIPPVVPITEADYQPEARYNQDSILMDGWEITFTDPPGDNYYALTLELMFGGQNANRICYETLDPALAEVDVLNNGGDFVNVCEGFFTDNTFDGSHYTVQVFTDNNLAGQPGNKMRIILSHINVDAFRHLQSSRLQERTEGNPFAEPVIVYSNIDNGFGVIGGMVTDTLIVDL